MSPPRHLSIFHQDGEKKFLDVSGLKTLDNPSKFRSMILVTTDDNDRVKNIMQRYNFRELDGFF
jgi:hypothetical protein